MVNPTHKRVRPQSSGDFEDCGSALQSLFAWLLKTLSGHKFSSFIRTSGLQTVDALRFFLHFHCVFVCIFFAFSLRLGRRRLGEVWEGWKCKPPRGCCICLAFSLRCFLHFLYFVFFAFSLLFWLFLACSLRLGRRRLEEALGSLEMQTTWGCCIFFAFFLRFFCIFFALFCFFCIYLAIFSCIFFAFSLRLGRPRLGEARGRLEKQNT